METFGQNLRQAMENRGLRLHEVASATGLEIGHIEALQRDDFGALPDEPTLRRGLGALARLLEVDPDQVIADFRLERQRSAPPPQPRHEPRTYHEPAARHESTSRYEPEALTLRSPSRRFRLALPALVVAALAVVGFLFWPRGSTERAAGRPASRPQEQLGAIGAPAPPAASTPSVPAARASTIAPLSTQVRSPEKPKPAPAISPPGGTSRLLVADQGVGKGIISHDLVDETRRFAEGDRVFYWTRIEGAAAGESIVHVWIHDGEEALRVPIRLGGARWRTHSYKDLNAGSAGSWVVEARDKSGRVLAHREFSCSRSRGDGR